MGLDMYLEKRTYVKHWEHKGDANYEVTVTKYGNPVPSIKSKRVKYVIEEVGYWRKANHIHKWFVDNVQDGKDDCDEYFVSDQKLKELLEVCKTVLEDNSKAGELLPTQSGFFFGATEYDEYYIRDIQDTVKIIEDVLAEVDENGYMEGDVYYQSSW